jgi:hypothetical protein
MKFTKGEIICREDLGYPEGGLVCDGYDDGGRLLAHPLGGGFQLKIPTHEEQQFRAVAEEEKTAVVFMKGKFGLADRGRSFDGWSKGELWNGWDTPRFEASVCQEILKFLGDARSRFDGDADAFVTVNNEDGEEMWPAEEITISDGSRIKVYPLGTGSWIWEGA